MNEKIISPITFDFNEGIFRFRYLGKIESEFEVTISWNGLTLHNTKLKLNADDVTTYYIGYNPSIKDDISSVTILFESEHFSETFFYQNPDKIVTKKFRSFETKKEDPSYYSYHEVFYKKIYEDKLIKINEGDVVVDIGANYGFFSNYAQDFKPSKIISFEPSKVILNYLRQNVSDITILDKGIAGTTGKRKFGDNAISSASSRMVDGEDGYEIDVIGINDLLNSLALDKIDFLKIDCEGAEKEIFESISNHTLNRINKIVVEFHSEEIKNIILSKLELNNFVIQRVTTELIFAYKSDYYKNKKKIALISTYCDNQEKKDIFLDLVKKMKSLGIDVIAISPLPLDKEHIEACDYIYFTKENPILKWPVRLFTFWRQMNLADGRILTMQRGVGDYSWAALYHVKKLTQIAMDYEYDIFYHMIYDLEVDEIVEEAIKNFQGNIVYPRRDPHHPETLWETTLHFMSFDRDLMKQIEKEITLQEYLSTNGVAEGEVFKWKNKFNISGAEHPVRDKIFYWKDYNFFDYSPVKDFKLFLSKNDEMDIWLGENPIYCAKLPPKLRVNIYDFENLDKLIFIINDKEYEVNPKSHEFVEFDIKSNEIQKFVINYKGENYDISKTYDEIMMNQIYYNHRP